MSCQLCEMIRLGVFLAFFFAAFFVPAWPVLLVIGVVWLIREVPVWWRQGTATG